MFCFSRCGDSVDHFLVFSVTMRSAAANGIRIDHLLVFSVTIMCAAADGDKQVGQELFHCALLHDAAGVIYVPLPEAGLRGGSACPTEPEP